MTAFSPFQPYSDPVPVPPSAPLPILVAAAGPEPQRRMTVAFRLILAVPQVFVVSALGVAAWFVSFLGWWGALVTGRLPRFATDFLGGYLRWTIRAAAYTLLLTDRYPPFSLDDNLSYPVRVAIPERGVLNRAAVLFRFILVIPVYVVATVVSTGTLLSFIAWLITLVSGRLPAPFRLAFTAMLRYQARLLGYWWLLTPAYPRGLFGDAAGEPATEEAPAAGEPATAKTDAAGEPATEEAPAAETAQGPDTDGGVPAAYGPPVDYAAQPIIQPPRWTVSLSRGAKGLVAAFLVLGSIAWSGSIAGSAVAIDGIIRQAQAHAAAVNALHKLNASYSALEREGLRWQQKTEQCRVLSCYTKLDSVFAGYFTAFANQLAVIRIPGSAVSTEIQLHADATGIASAFIALSETTAYSQYQTVLGTWNLQSRFSDFGSDYAQFHREMSNNLDR